MDFPINPQATVEAKPWHNEVTVEQRRTLTRALMQTMMGLRQNFDHARLLHLAQQYERSSFMKSNTRLEYMENMKRKLADLRELIRQHSEKPNQQQPGQPVPRSSTQTPAGRMNPNWAGSASNAGGGNASIPAMGNPMMNQPMNPMNMNQMGNQMNMNRMRQMNQDPMMANGMNGSGMNSAGMNAAGINTGRSASSTPMNPPGSSGTPVGGRRPTNPALASLTSEERDKLLKEIIPHGPRSALPAQILSQFPILPPNTSTWQDIISLAQQNILSPQVHSQIKEAYQRYVSQYLLKRQAEIRRNPSSLNSGGSIGGANIMGASAPSTQPTSTPAAQSPAQMQSQVQAQAQNVQAQKAQLERQSQARYRQQMLMQQKQQQQQQQQKQQQQQQQQQESNAMVEPASGANAALFGNMMGGIPFNNAGAPANRGIAGQGAPNARGTSVQPQLSYNGHSVRDLTSPQLLAAWVSGGFTQERAEISKLLEESKRDLPRLQAEMATKQLNLPESDQKFVTDEITRLARMMARTEKLTILYYLYSNKNKDATLKLMRLKPMIMFWMQQLSEFGRYLTTPDQLNAVHAELTRFYTFVSKCTKFADEKQKSTGVDLTNNGLAPHAVSQTMPAAQAGMNMNQPPSSTVGAATAAGGANIPNNVDRISLLQMRQKQAQQAQQAQQQQGSKVPQQPMGMMPPNMPNANTPARGGMPPQSMMPMPQSQANGNFMGQQNPGMGVNGPGVANQMMGNQGVAGKMGMPAQTQAQMQRMLNENGQRNPNAASMPNMPGGPQMPLGPMNADPSANGANMINPALARNAATPSAGPGPVPGAVPGPQVPGSMMGAVPGADPASLASTAAGANGVSNPAGGAAAKQPPAPFVREILPPQKPRIENAGKLRQISPQDSSKYFLSVLGALLKVPPQEVAASSDREPGTGAPESSAIQRSYDESPAMKIRRKMWHGVVAASEFRLAFQDVDLVKGNSEPQSAMLTPPYENGFNSGVKLEEGINGFDDVPESKVKTEESTGDAGDGEWDYMSLINI